LGVVEGPLSDDDAAPAAEAIAMCAVFSV